MASTFDRAVYERALAAEKAIDALGRYKFERFGYWASQWVLLNRIIGDRSPSPFTDLVKAARELQPPSPEDSERVCIVHMSHPPEDAEKCEAASYQEGVCRIYAAGDVPQLWDGVRV